LHRAAPTAGIDRITQMAQASPATPKPKMKNLIIGRNRYAGVSDESSPLGRVFGPPGSPLQDWPAVDQSGPSLREELSGSNGAFPGRIEFFGSVSRQRKVCWLVDCSGSMQGLFTQVRKKLKESIAALQPDQYFYVIFFGDGKLYELGDGRLLRATPKTKSAAESLIDSVRPAGTTNAMDALERAVRIRDDRDAGASVVYFLTDGFELTKEDSTDFPQKIADLLERFAPAMRINTIAFLPQENDRTMLETIARQSGGEFLCVTGGR